MKFLDDVKIPKSKFSSHIHFKMATHSDSWGHLSSSQDDFESFFSVFLFILYRQCIQFALRSQQVFGKAEVYALGLSDSLKKAKFRPGMV